MLPQVPPSRGRSPRSPPTFGRILVAADFSESSRQAFRIACSLAREGAARLFVLHVVEPPLVLGESGSQSPLAGGDGNRLAALEEQLRGSCIAANSADVPYVDRADLEERLRGSYLPGPGLDVEYLVRPGASGGVILGEAEGLGCDLIVLGTHGRTGLGRALMGSVAEAVLREARCPVLTVRTPVHADPVPDVATGSVVVS